MLINILNQTKFGTPVFQGEEPDAILQKYFLPNATCLKNPKFFEERINEIVSYSLKRCSVSKHATIHPSAVVEHAVLIGDSVEIGPHSYLRRGTVICDNCKIGHSAEINNSTIFPNSTIGHHSYVGYSFLGSNFLIGANSTLCGRRLDDQYVSIQSKIEQWKTTQHKLGTIAHQNVRIGSNIAIMPGTFCFSGLRIHQSREAVKIKGNYR